MNGRRGCFNDPITGEELRHGVVSDKVNRLGEKERGKLPVLSE